MTLDEQARVATHDATIGGAADPESWRLLVGPRLLVVALVLWAWGLIDVDLRAMSDHGLLSVLPAAYFLALAALTVGFLFVLDRSVPNPRLLGAYVLALVTMVHATPALLSDTAWHSSAYPQLGSIDGIERTGELGLDQAALAIHAGWPGSLGFAALLAESTGFDPMTVARWTPFAVVLLTLLALVHVFRGFTSDSRVVWLGVWFVVLGNWIAHQLFSPLGFASAFHFALLAVTVAYERWPAGRPGRTGSTDPIADGPRRSVVAGVMLCLGVVISTTDPITALVCVASLGALVVARVARAGWIAVALAAMSIIWLSAPALDAVRRDALSTADDARLRSETSTTSPLDLDLVGAGHEAAVVADRFLVQAVIVLAIVGFVVLSRRRGSMPIALLAAAPTVVLVLRLDLDALFRAYTFALPWLAFAAASGLVALTDRRDVVTSLGARALVITVLLIAFLFAHFGRHGVAYFTAQEIELSDWIADHAGPATLVVVGSPNHPLESRAVDRITVVALTDARAPNLVAADDDHEAVLFTLLNDDRYDAGYVVLTRSMYQEQRHVPTAPDGLFDRIERVLRASDRFDIVHANVDGTVWAPAGEASP